jgi:hypothetical protein
METVQLLADSTGTDPAEWAECDGPAQRGTPLSAWFVRRRAGSPDVYAIASGDSETMTLELIPAEPDERDAYAVARGVLSGRAETAQPDIECGVVYDGPVPGAEGPARPGA